MQTEDLDVNIDAVDDTDLQVEVEETAFDNPDDEGRPVASADDPDDDPTEEELNQVQSVRIRQRLNQLTAARHAERRRAEQAEKERAEALRAADAYRQAAERERAQRLVLTGTAARTTRAALSEQVNALTARYKKALEEGDTDAQVQAMTALSQVQSELRQIPSDEIIQRDVEAEQQKPLAPVALPPRAPELHPKVQDWVAKNSTWWNKDAAMTQAAAGLANILETNEGLTPDSDEYFRRIEQALAAGFPTKFKPSAPKKEAPVSETTRRSPAVAPINRLPNGKTQVKLTREQVAVAENLGVPLQEYARELIKMNQSR